MNEKSSDDRMRVWVVGVCVADELSARVWIEMVIDEIEGWRKIGTMPRAGGEKKTTVITPVTGRSERLSSSWRLPSSHDNAGPLLLMSALELPLALRILRPHLPCYLVEHLADVPVPLRACLVERVVPLIRQ